MRYGFGPRAASLGSWIDHACNAYSTRVGPRAACRGDIRRRATCWNTGDYRPITPSASSETVTLTGRSLSIEDIVKVARGGARVELAPAARQQEADNYGLLLGAAAEDVPVYWFNRGAADQRETVIFKGYALAPGNRGDYRAAAA